MGGEPDSFRQMFFFKLPPDGVVAGIGNISKPICHSKRKENSRVRSNCDAGVTLLDLAEGHEDGHGDEVVLVCWTRKGAFLR